MTHVRYVSAIAIFVLFSFLALFTDSFWWFLKVNWQTVWSDFGGGIGKFDTACIWAVWHGIASSLFAITIARTLDKPFHSTTEYALKFIGIAIIVAAVFAISDLGSGWWMLIEGGKYIPLSWCAFLQPFLIVYLLAIQCLRPRIQPKQKLLF